MIVIHAGFILGHPMCIYVLSSALLSQIEGRLLGHGSKADNFIAPSVNESEVRWKALVRVHFEDPLI